jgi:hypothetical protein
MEHVEQAPALLQRSNRMSLWAMNRESSLDDEFLDELVEDLFDVKQVAAHDGKVLDGRADSGLLGP